MGHPGTHDGGDERGDGGPGLTGTHTTSTGDLWADACMALCDLALASSALGCSAALLVIWALGREQGWSRLSIASFGGR